MPEKSDISGMASLSPTALIDRLPAPFRPYARLMRLDKPIGTWLLLLPCWWSLALAAPKFPDLWLMFLFALGAIAMRGAGCIVNDITDRNLDKLVARTATRPLASGEVQLWQAIVFLIALLLIGLGILLCLNNFTVWLGASSLILVFLYPLMKRITWWPQLVLGFTFNWGALLGWSAVTGTIGLPTLPLYIAGIFWTLGYDTIYAHQDIKDDITVGIKSTARLFGEATLPWVGLFYAIAILFLMLTGVSAGLGKSYYIVLTGAALFAAFQLFIWRMNDPDNCLKRFRANRDFGLIILAAIIIGKFA
jgi:4-hydroxybenzoate polyprenyltransferase